MLVRGDGPVFPSTLVVGGRGSLGVLEGVPSATLDSWLATAQQAYADLQSGAKVVSASYSQGDGSKTVTYNMTSMANLQAWIGQLQRALGMPHQVRRPMRPFFR